MAQTAKTSAMQASATYEIKGWDEKTWDGKNWNEVSGPKQTHAIVSLAYHGDLEAEAEVHFLMSYQEDGATVSAGFQRVTGTLGGKHGGFVLQDNGGFKDGVATSHVTVVPGSGSGELAGLRGEGTSVADQSGKLELTLTYSFEK